MEDMDRSGYVSNFCSINKWSLINIIGEYGNDVVAAKVFKQCYETEWQHELDMYKNYTIQHPNIVKFLESGKLFCKSCICLFSLTILK